MPLTTVLTLTNIGDHTASLEKWVSDSLALGPFNTTHVVMTPNQKIISLLLDKYNFATGRNCNVNNM